MVPGTENDSEPRGVYASLRSLLHFDLAEQATLVRHLVFWVVIGSGVGVLAGTSSAAFLSLLDWATATRTEQDWLLYLLPLAGLAIGLSMHTYGGEARRGNNLLLDEIHEPTAWVPRRMAPLVLATTVATHLFGGSAGREGTAIQMSGSLSDSIIGRVANLTGADRRILLIAAISGGFGAVFGVPIAGFVFGLEVQSLGRIRHDAIVAALTASVVGDQMVSLLGVGHTPLPVIGPVEFDALLAVQLLAAGVAFGLAAIAFIELTHGLRRLAARWLSWPPLRPVIGGVLIVGLTLAIGTRDYLGLSIPLIVDSLPAANGQTTTIAGVAGFAFAWKLLFTAITLGSGFQGGEVTPLFVIGTTLGASLGTLFDAPVGLLAAVGFVAVFAGATNTPIACTIMGIELFGSGIAVPLAIGCVTAYVCSSNRGIYDTQRIAVSKLGANPSGSVQRGTIAEEATFRRPWLPDRD